jgi:signal recognition particle subunit SRP54
MFENLTEKLEKIFKDLRGYGKLTPKNIDDALREVRFLKTSKMLSVR